MSQYCIFGANNVQPGTYVETLTSNSGGAVSPDLTGNINVEGDGTTITGVGNPGTHTITFSAGGGISTTFDGDTGSATPSAGVITFTGGSTGLTFSAASSTLTLTGTLNITHGGTSATSFAHTDGVIYYDGTRLVATANGTNGQLFTATTGGAPSWQNVPASSISITGDSGGALTGNAFTFTGGTTGLTFAGAGTTETLGGTLVVANGGTGDTSFTAYAPICGGTTTTGPLQSASTGISTSGFVLTSTGSSSLPTFQNISAAGATKSFSTDSGTATPSSGVITFNANTNSGKTVLFTGSGSTVSLKVTDSNNNTIIGSGSGAALSGASNNTAFGSASLAADISSNANCAFGFESLQSCTGANNSAFGTATAPSLTSGVQNCFLGRSSGSSYTSSESNNILLGYNVSGTVGESNVCRIGLSTGTGAGQINATYISGIDGINVGSTAKVVTESGNQLGTATITAGTGISVTPGANTITIAATTGGVTSISGTANQVTASASTGAITLSTPSTFIAPGSIASTTTITATSGNITATSGNVVITAGNLTLPTTTSSSLGVILIGGSSFMHSYGALTDDNTFVGQLAGNFTLTSGTATDNVGVGTSALAALTTGAQNCAIGGSSLAAVTTGTANTGLGAGAGSVFTTGSYNTFIGTAAGINQTTSDSSNILIGAGVGGTGGNSNRLIIGAGTGTSNEQINVCTISGITGKTSSSGAETFTNASGVLGTSTSASRFKDNIKDMGEDSSKIYDLRPVTFTYKEDGTHVDSGESQKKQYGLIAEEVEPIYPDMCLYNLDGELYTLKYRNLAPMLLNELQKLRKEVEFLKSKLG